MGDYPELDNAGDSQQCLTTIMSNYARTNDKRRKAEKKRNPGIKLLEIRICAGKKSQILKRGNGNATLRSKVEMAKINGLSSLKTNSRLNISALSPDSIRSSDRSVIRTGVLRP